MKKIVLNAYLMFEGNCREATVFYEALFGGTLKFMTFGDVDDSCPDALKDNIMHASLMGGDVEFMGSDNTSSKPNSSGNVSLALSGYDEEQLTQLFDDLGKRGRIIIPMAKQVWGDTFGVVTDRFGIDWMINIGGMKPESLSF